MDVINTNHLNKFFHGTTKSTGTITKSYVEVVKAEERLKMPRCLRNKGSARKDVIGTALRVENSRKE